MSGRNALRSERMWLMATLLVVGAASATYFGTMEPLRLSALLAGFIFLWPSVQRLDWRFDPVAIFAGVAVGMLWVSTATAGDYPLIVGPGGAAFALWVAARLIGTALLAPVVQELIFRGHLLSRLAPEGAPSWRICFGIIATTALFAVIHDRWLVACIAGLVYALLSLRARNVTDAITAHMAASLSIATWAIVTGAWYVI